MKKILSCTKTLIILLVLTAILSALYVYVISRPISYGMEYHNKTVYDGEKFEGVMKFNPDGTLQNRNTNYDEEMVSRYYYKNGYVFYVAAQTGEEYKNEVAMINDEFDSAVNTPFYADEINAFRLVAEEDDGYSTVYTCMAAILIAVAGGVIEALLLGLIIASLIIRKK